MLGQVLKAGYYAEVVIILDNVPCCVRRFSDPGVFDARVFYKIFETLLETALMLWVFRLLEPEDDDMGMQFETSELLWGDVRTSRGEG